MDKTRKIKTIDAVYIGVFAAIIAACSWITVPAGAVPVTLQTMAVCLTAGLLGAKRGTLTVFVYILLGVIGVPVFAGFSSGIGYVLGATGGYLMGFVFTAVIVGVISKHAGKRIWVYLLSMVLGIAVCYAFGIAWFILVYGKNSINAESLANALALCVAPFVVPDLVKAALASVLCVKLNKYIK